MAQVVPAVAVNQNATDPPIPTILARLNEHAPILPRNASATDIVIHRLRMVNVCNEYACSEYVIGPLPANLDPQSVQLGKRFYLSAFEDPDLRGLIASKGRNGPQCWAWVGNNMLGGRDEQEILNTILNDLTYDGSSNVLAFYAQYSLISTGIQPALPDARLCTHYASRFPAQEYMAILSTCDANPGHTDFQAYASAVNNGIQRFHQRLQIQDARTSHIPNSFGVWPRNLDDVEIDEHDAGEFFYTPPTRTMMDADMAEVNQIAKAIMPAVLSEAHAAIMKRRGGQSGSGALRTNSRRHQQVQAGKGLPPPLPPAAQMSSSARATPTSTKPSIKRNCTNCGQPGHTSKDCKRPTATCTFPLCKSRGLTKHITSECWFKHPEKCPPAFKAKRDKVMREAKVNALFATNNFVDLEDEEVVPDDFADLAIDDTNHEGQAQAIEIFCTDVTPGEDADKIIAIDQLGCLRVDLFDDLCQEISLQMLRKFGISATALETSYMVLKLFKDFYSSTMITSDLELSSRIQASSDTELYLAMSIVADCVAAKTPPAA